MFVACASAVGHLGLEISVRLLVFWAESPVGELPRDQGPGAVVCDNSMVKNTCAMDITLMQLNQQGVLRLLKPHLT